MHAYPLRSAEDVILNMNDWYLSCLVYCADEKKDVFLLDGYIFSGLSDELKQQIVVSSDLHYMNVNCMHVCFPFLLLLFILRILGCSIWETGCSRKV